MRSDRLGIFFLLLGDFLILTILFFLSMQIRSEIFPLFYEFPDLTWDLRSFWWFYPVFIFFLIYEGLYTKRLTLWEESFYLTKVSILATVLILSIAALGKISEEVSRSLVVTSGVVICASFPLCRYLFKRFLLKLGIWEKKILVLGTGKIVKAFIQSLQNEPGLGYKVVGCLESSWKIVKEDKICGVKVLRYLEHADRYIRLCKIPSVAVVLPELSHSEPMALISKLQRQVEEVLIIPTFQGISMVDSEVQYFLREFFFLLRFKNNLAKGFNIASKRTFDFLGALFILIILSPFLLLIALLIKITTGEAVFFVQDRIGQDGQLFKCYKFKTMYENADEILQEVLENDPQAREEWEKYWKLTNDPRVTPIGRFLRKTSLDELPQLLNVIKGEMSLVGPRPYLPREKEEMGEYKDLICLVPPGITGLWQVSGRNQTTYEKRLILDSWYVKNWTFWLDIIILFKTVVVLIRREGSVT